MKKYVHGYSKKENDRLYDQAGTLVELLHGDTRYKKGECVLEAGCGVGAQTIILAGNSPQADITSIDFSDESMSKACMEIRKRGITNVKFACADIFDLPFKTNTFDHVFVCFVLEHLADPVKALKCLKRVIKKGGTITVIEGDHDSSLFHPYSEKALKTIKCLIELQAKMGGNSLIGRQLYPLLKKAGFRNVDISPRFVYADSSNPEMVDGFTKKTYIAMVKGVREKAVSSGMISSRDWDKGIKDLNKTAGSNGVFCYTFFKGIAIK